MRGEDWLRREERGEASGHSCSCMPAWARGAWIGGQEVLPKWCFLVGWFLGGRELCNSPEISAISGLPPRGGSWGVVPGGSGSCVLGRRLGGGSCPEHP